MNAKVEGGPVTFLFITSTVFGATRGIQTSCSVMIFWAAITSWARFVTGVDQGSPTQGALDDLCQDIEARAPTLIIDTSPANVRDSGKAPMVDLPAMVSVLRSYQRQATIDGIVIYKLVQPAATCGTASRTVATVGGR